MHLGFMAVLSPGCIARAWREIPDRLRMETGAPGCVPQASFRFLEVCSRFPANVSGLQQNSKSGSGQGGRDTNSSSLQLPCSRL